MSSPHAKVFVYGTLLSGEPNHGVLSRARLIGPARSAADYELVNLGPFPALVAEGQTAVVGQVYGVDRQTLKRLDELEGHPHFYVRKTILLADGGEVEAYLLPRAQAEGFPRIPSGDWRAREEDDPV